MTKDKIFTRPIESYPEATSEIARLTTQRDRLAKQIAWMSQESECRPDGSDLVVVRWACEVGFLEESDYTLFRDDHATTWEDIPGYLD